MKVGIIGGSGYGGAELFRLLAGHPVLDAAVVAAGSQAGARLEEVFPHLSGLEGADAVLGPSTPEHVVDCDVVFLATPHATSLELAPPLIAAGTPVIDLSGAFRLDAGTFESWYGLAHTAPDLAPASYGLPELFRAALPGAPLVAGPGCYPTASLLALAPLAGLVDADSVVVVGMSGTSGAGKGLREDLHASHAFGNVAPYGAPRHRHTPEIERYWAKVAGAGDDPATVGDRGRSVTFVPHLVPMARGMMCTVTATLGQGIDEETVRDAYVEAYGEEHFVTLRQAQAWPATAQVVGANAAHVGVAVDPRTGRVTAACAIDNLVKGASGQALQAANIVLGLDETLGLSVAGLYP